MDNEKISFENSKRIRERRMEAQRTITDMVSKTHMETLGREFFNEVVKQQYHHLNKMVFDLAERQGVSVFDICLRYMPEYAEPQVDLAGDGVNMAQELRLVPLPLEFEKGPDYWQDKYLLLKKRMQELIDSIKD